MKRFQVLVREIRELSHRVKAFTLEYGEAPFQFKAGQWVDLFALVNGKREVGGYSITSSPKRSGSFDLAIRYSAKHPVTRHLHETARVGDLLEVSGGNGTFFFQPEPPQVPIVLLGGGIGITPLVSIFRAASEVPDQEVTLIHTASRVEDFVFRDELLAIAQANPRVKLVFSLTGEAPEWRGERGRISPELLARVGLNREAIHYLCGPRGLIDEMSVELERLGVAREKIRYEKWW